MEKELKNLVIIFIKSELERFAWRGDNRFSGIID